jgi:glyoxylase-like metal-dependent hydrolase (beta-lactamase superfamily II)
MKIYNYVSLEHFSNCYLITEDMTMQAIIVDPCKINAQILTQIESGPYQLVAALVTHNHTGHTRGISVLQKIYDLKIYAADYEMAKNKAAVLKDDGTLRLAGLDIRYFSVPGHSFDSMVFQIGKVLFTGDVITAGLVGTTYSSYTKKLLVSTIKEKIFSQDETCILLPGHGPPTTIGAEKKFNTDLRSPTPPQADGAWCSPEELHSGVAPLRHE